MDAGFWFWLFYVLTVLGFIGSTRTNETWRPFLFTSGSVIVFVLLGLLGYRVFQGPIQ